ncbi:M14 family zinc carboxypeptidase [Agilicoccus flavus]|uniref:M14 family zinc carboxypeptidase n=1 Tax=Agilicoccus flavus TaxID=2775968 RepID=UPI001CF70ADF|nr:M14 family zinc carboxypeptidase [Agilicoccus flavus]
MSAAAVSAAAATDVVAKRGSVGAVVAEIDRALRASEIRNFGRARSTGVLANTYGPLTTSRVRAFQARNGLRATGAVDERTYAMLRPTFKLKPGTQTVARSVRGRPITVRVVGDLGAKKRVIVVGCIHGNECAGLPILDAVARRGAPRGVAYVLVARPNPDGAAAGTRHNARKVDLNRNFVGWTPKGKPGYVYYPGRGALSEPESLALYDLVRSVKPTAYVTYHQALRCVDYAGAGAQVARTYARLSGLPVKVLPAYHGSNGTWLGTRHPDVKTLTVELSRPVPASMISRNVTALRHLATHH